MGLYKFRPVPSGRMGILSTIINIKDGVIVEFGSMGHMYYSSASFKRKGIFLSGNMYSTHIDEVDISLGRTKRLDKVVDEIMNFKKPKAVFLLPSSIPELVGVDLDYKIDEYKGKYPSCHFIKFDAGGFKEEENHGVEEALYKIVEEIPRDNKVEKKLKYNIIGSCSDLYKYKEDEIEIKRLMKNAFNLKSISVLSSETSIEEIENMAEASINIVLRKEAVKAAELLKERFGTPFIYMRPYGYNGTIKWLEEISGILNLPIGKEFLEDEEEIKNILNKVQISFAHEVMENKKTCTINLFGHYEVVKGIGDFAYNEVGLYKGIIWHDRKYFEREEMNYYKEDDWMKFISKIKEEIVMGSGEILNYIGKSSIYKISNPDISWNINPYAPPLVGTRGALYLANIWLNACSGIE